MPSAKGPQHTDIITENSHTSRDLNRSLICLCYKFDIILLQKQQGLRTTLICCNLTVESILFWVKFSITFSAPHLIVRLV